MHLSEEVSVYLTCGEEWQRQSDSQDCVNIDMPTWGKKV